MNFNIRMICSKDVEVIFVQLKVVEDNVFGNVSFVLHNLISQIYNECWLTIIMSLFHLQLN